MCWLVRQGRAWAHDEVNNLVHLHPNKWIFISDTFLLTSYLWHLQQDISLESKHKVERDPRCSAEIHLLNKASFLCAPGLSHLLWQWTLLPTFLTAGGAQRWNQRLHSSQQYSLDVVTNGNLLAEKAKFVLGYISHMWNIIWSSSFNLLLSNTVEYGDLLYLCSFAVLLFIVAYAASYFQILMIVSNTKNRAWEIISVGRY